MTKKTLTKTRDETDIRYDDVDEIIEIAARKKHAAAEMLRLDDIREVANELGIDDEHVEDAVIELERRREREAQKKEERRALIKKGVAGVAGAAIVVTGMAWIGSHQLRSDLTDARQQRSQVANVVDRHEQTAEYFADREDSIDRSAELQGALNRVSVETRRYDEAASRYNRRAEGFPSSLWTSIFDLPDELPLSDEIDDW